MGRFSVRRIAMIAVIGIGVIVALAGAALAAWMGPDGMRTSGPQPVDTDASVIVTDIDVLDWNNAHVHINATFDGPKAVFIGMGNAVDVQDFLSDAERVQVTEFEMPWSIETEEIAGEPTLAAAPTAIDWWQAHSAGIGGAGIDFVVPPEASQVVIMGFEGSDLSGMTLEVGYSLPIGFTGALGLIPAGLGSAFAAWWIGSGRPVLLEREEDVGRSVLAVDPEDDEIVYVWIDEDGVEHEVGADEVHDFEVVEEPPGSDDVVYVWIDDDGVEHEISPDEAQGLEVVEERVDDVRDGEGRAR